MTRIHRLPVEQWDPELREAANVEALTPMQLHGLEVSANAPHMAKAVGAFFAIAKAGQTLEPRLVELVRLRIAFHNQCRTCMAMRYQSGADDGVTDDLVCSLEKPMEAPDLTPREKAALAHADRFATDHLSIDETHFAALREHFSEAQIVELATFIAAFVGFGRLAATFDMIEDLPKYYQDKTTKVTPWQHEGVLV